MPDRKEPSSPEALQKALTTGVPLERWKEGLMFDGMNPTPGLRSASNWFPRTEDLGPDEIRIIFMGTSPTIRPGQMNTSILVQLGNGDNFVFDLGEGAIANYVAGGMALNELDKVFITHLHVDHFGSLPYLYMFGGWAGRWHKPLRVFGPSGHDPEYGTEAMIDGMKKMVGWHKDAFSIFPVGKAWDIEVNEFDFRDNGGVVYNENGVEVIHWQRSHAKDGASGYRLNWNGMSVVWTGDGRPSDLDIEYAAGADVYITEAQPEVIAISSGVQGVPPFVGRFTVDMHHTPAYAAGYLASQIQPRLLMTTHMPFDTYLNEETVAEVRHHWDGPYHFGAPDGIVVNVTKDDIWVREGILPDYPNNKAPQFDFDEGQLVIPAPHHAREDIQEPFVRDHEIPPEMYYPEGYQPGVLDSWPVDGELVAPVEVLPEKMFQSMSENWRNQQIYKKHVSELTAEAE